MDRTLFVLQNPQAALQSKALSTQHSFSKTHYLNVSIHTEEPKTPQNAAVAVSGLHAVIVTGTY